MNNPNKRSQGAANAFKGHSRKRYRTDRDYLAAIYPEALQAWQDQKALFASGQSSVQALAAAMSRLNDLDNLASRSGNRDFFDKTLA